MRLNIFKGQLRPIVSLGTVLFLFVCLLDSATAEGNCFVSNCEQDENPCGEFAEKNVAIYKERCRLHGGGGRRRSSMGTIAICCRPSSDEGMLMTAYGAEPHEFPHMVSVLDHCGGTLINRRYVLTAAHCVSETRNGTVGDKTFTYNAPLKEKVYVRVGTNIKTAGEKLKVSQVVVHPFYSRLLENLKTDQDKLKKSKPILYDLALLKLDKEVEISDTVRTLKLADPDFKPSQYSKRSVMLGWGSSDDVKPWFGTYYLQKVSSPIRSDRECPIWDVEPYHKHRSKLICVGGYVEDDYAPTAGPGDSGGPLICKDSFSRAVLCGVASFAGDEKACAKRLKNGSCYPNAFSSVPYFHEWIVNITGPQQERDFYRPVLNGEASTKTNEFPHEVYINSTDGTACGGTLITNDVVLTAAHCILNEQLNFRVDLTVYAGIHSPSRKGRGVQVFNIDLVHGPPKFRKRWDRWVNEDSALIIADKPHFYEDIILVQLDRPIVDSRYVGVLPWATQEEDVTEEAVEISWKLSKDNQPFIQKRKFNLMGREECQDRLDRIREVRRLSLAATSICGVEEYSGGSACDRTTGGPMLCTTADRRETYVCGIQSFRFCNYALPNVVTNVASYADWIEDGLERFERERGFNDYYARDFDYDSGNQPTGPTEAGGPRQGEAARGSPPAPQQLPPPPPPQEGGQPRGQDGPRPRPANPQSQGQLQPTRFRGREFYPPFRPE